MQEWDAEENIST